MLKYNFWNIPYFDKSLKILCMFTCFDAFICISECIIRIKTCRQGAKCIHFLKANLNGCLTLCFV